MAPVAARGHSGLREGTKMDPRRVNGVTRAESLMAHLDSAYNLARWLVDSDPGAEQVVHETFVRAIHGSKQATPDLTRAWVLGIVRTNSYEWLATRSPAQLAAPLAEERLGTEVSVPELAEVLCRADALAVERALRGLPIRLREVLVLRELEDLTYEEIARVTATTVGAVASLLSRARGRFRQAVGDRLRRDGQDAASARYGP